MMAPHMCPDSPAIASASQGITEPARGGGQPVRPPRDSAGLMAGVPAPRKTRRSPPAGVALMALVTSLVLTLAGCAAPGARPHAVAAGAGPETDAVLPAPDGWRIFQLGTRRHAVVPARPDAWVRGVPRAPVWKTLAAPSGAFRPVQAVPGHRGYFYLVDAASARLCLYDAGASLLSTYPLPPEFTPFPAGRAAVFRGADGAFTFVDYGAGEASQYADRQMSEAGASRWIPRGRVKLPAGIRDCVQPPGSTELFCRDAGGAPLRFDGSLNRVSPRTQEESVAPILPALPGGLSRGEGMDGGWIVPRWTEDGWSFEGRSPRSSAGSVDPVPNVRTEGDLLFRYRVREKTWDRPGAVPSDTTR
jgi:hypothetical protein